MNFEKSVHTEFEEAASRHFGDEKNKKLLMDLLVRGANVNGSKNDGRPLRSAITQRSRTLMQFLLNAGANPNARVKVKKQSDAFNPQASMVQGESVLHFAAHILTTKKMQDFEVPKIVGLVLDLVSGGADLSALDEDGNKPFDLLLRPGFHEPPTPLKRAFDLPLHAAILQNDPAMCLKLLDRGWDRQQKNGQKQTAWRLAELKSPQCLAAMRSWDATQAIHGIVSQAVAQTFMK